MHVWSNSKIGLPTYMLAIVGLVIATPQVRGDDPPRTVARSMSGYVVPVRQVSIAPKVAGQIVELPIEEGQRVEKGQVLARLDALDYALSLRLAQAEYKVAEARLDAADGKEAPENVAIAKAELEVAKVRVTVAQHRLDATVVHAPISGTILTKRVEVGSLVDPKALQASPTLCELADLSEMEVELHVPERELARIKLGQACGIRMAALPDTTYQGEVVRVLPLADRARGSVGVRVRIKIPKEDAQLRPEMSALVDFYAEKAEK